MRFGGPLGFESRAREEMRPVGLYRLGFYYFVAIRHRRTVEICGAQQTLHFRTIQRISEVLQDFALVL